jgi:beta-glucosidase
VPQVYVGPKAGGWEAPKRLAGWSKVSLAPGASATVSITVDPRLLSTFDEARDAWHAAPGDYEVWLGESSADSKLSTEVRLSPWSHPARWGAGIDHPIEAAMPRYYSVIASGR